MMIAQATDPHIIRFRRLLEIEFISIAAAAANTRITLLVVHRRAHAMTIDGK